TFAAGSPTIDASRQRWHNVASVADQDQGVRSEWIMTAKTNDHRPGSTAQAVACENGKRCIVATVL
ncbi:MAG: hypothetical protein L6437_12410, partial [Kiritimatiellae bacterium]|nr:hypothetical protein [Kiritimatiellia bacterium]